MEYESKFSCLISIESNIPKQKSVYINSNSTKFLGAKYLSVSEKSKFSSQLILGLVFILVAPSLWRVHNPPGDIRGGKQRTYRQIQQPHCTCKADLPAIMSLDPQGTFILDCNTVNSLREHFKAGQSPYGAVLCDMPVHPRALFPRRSTSVIFFLFCLSCSLFSCNSRETLWGAQGDSWVLPDLRSDVGSKWGNRGLLPWNQGPFHPKHSAGTSYRDTPSLVYLQQENTL